MRGVLAALLLFSALPAGATVLEDWSIQDIMDRSDLVVVGTVGSKSTSKRGEDVWTETEVIVERTILGTPQTTVIVTQLGGELDGYQMELVGDAHLESGERMLLFTSAGPDGRRYLVGMALGAFRLVGDTWEQSIDASIRGQDGRVRRAGNRRGSLAGLLAEILHK